MSRPSLPLLIALPLLLGGCASLMAPVTERLADNLSHAILNQDDPATVRDGAPAYLLLIDSLIEGDPDNADLLFTGARLYGAYAGAFVQEPERAGRLADRALGYAERGLCREARRACEAMELEFDAYSVAIADLPTADTEALYAYAVAWAGWVQARSGDWEALLALPRIRVALERVVDVDETIDGGGAHAYLGVLATLLPPSVGGRPEIGRRHFERAVELTEGRNLMFKVLFARHYARLVFDQALHDRLLGEVLESDADAPGLTLVNTLAQEQARELLAGSSDYF
jgi:hypothetical protein